MVSNRRLRSWLVVPFAVSVGSLSLAACLPSDKAGATSEQSASAALLADESGAVATATSVSGALALDGAISTGSATATSVSTITFAHTTGSGADRLTLVGIAANNYSTTRTVSTVTFTPSGGAAALTFSKVGSVQNGDGRLMAIYSLLAPPSGVSGTVAVTFSGPVSYGIVAGAANFTGVDQAKPLDAFATGTSTSTTVSLAVPSHNGDLVFDAVLLASSAPPTATPGSGQSLLWSPVGNRARGAASTKVATGSTTTMSWTAVGAGNWAVGGVSINPAGGGGPITPDFSVLLGKPTNTSIVANIIPNNSGDCYLEYGPVSGSYSAGKTETFACANATPVEILINGLSPNTQYYYRLQFKAASSSQWGAGTEHSFWTQRSPGSSFVFTVTSDTHESFTQTLQNAMANICNQRPDFNIDLGDIFITDNQTSQAAVNNKYLAYRKPLYFDRFSHSSSLFLSAGNHENEEGWNLDDTPLSLALASIQARKTYYPTPIDDGFYSANNDRLATLGGDQWREDYYAWTWGDALFVVIDPFQYTMSLPYAPAAGEGSGDSKTGDQWSWTLGARQFNWLKTTLQNSPAKYKFMFSHLMVGGIPRGPFGGAEAGYVRGGAEAAGYFEWGGANADGTPGFAAHRSSADFGTKPIHQLMTENGVSAYFHGHDHQYVHEKRDGIVYQEVPSPGSGVSAFSGVYTVDGPDTGSRPYSTIKILPSSGHLRISIGATKATVDYLSSATGSNGQIQDSYDINPNGSPTPPPAPTGVSATDGSYADKVRVTWTAVSGATSYQIFRNTSASTSGAIQIATPSASPYDDASATPGTVYTFFVKACSAALCSDYSASDSGYRLAAQPDAGADSGSAPTAPALDGVVARATADGASTISFGHTTGRGTDRLLLVGISANSYGSACTPTSVTFTPSGGSARALSSVGSIQNGSGRLAAIYTLLNPPTAVSGTVEVAFSGSVGYGIVAGAANFQGVDQATPLGPFASATGTSSAISLSVPSHNGDLTFATVFLGSATPPTVTAGAAQSSLWYSSVDRTGGTASTKAASGATTAMSWTAASSSNWAAGGVSINPSGGP